MQQHLELFKHIYIDNKAKKTLILFHGTGGDEHNLLFFDDILEKKYNFLGLRGNTNEAGMTRFFRRFESGSFDQENIRKETKKLHIFMKAWMGEYKLSVADFVYLGYSNGANMILATLFYFPDLINTAVLLHGMLPFTPKKKVDFSSHSIFVSYGLYDEMIPTVESLKIVNTLQALEARLSVHEYASGHEVTQDELGDVAEFLKK